MLVQVIGACWFHNLQKWTPLATTVPVFLQRVSSERTPLKQHKEPRAALIGGLFDDYAFFFFNALRFLVAVLSDLSGCSCVLKAIFSNLSIRSGSSRSLIRSFFFIAHPSAIKGLLRTTQHELEDRCVGNEAPLVIKISDRFKMQRKVYPWEEHRKCTICDNVTVRSPIMTFPAKFRRLRGSNVGLLTTYRDAHQFGIAQLLHAPPARPIRGP